MSRVVFLFGFFLAFGASAATKTYEVSMDLSMDGKKISSPRLVAADGEVASVSAGSEQGTSFIDVVATEEVVGVHKGIMMKMKIGWLSADGTRTVVAEPTILAAENKKASVIIGQDDKSEIALDVVAIRQAN